MIEISKGRYVQLITAAGAIHLNGYYTANGQETKAMLQNSVTVEDVIYMSTGAGGASFDRDQIADMKASGKIPEAYWPRGLTLSPQDQQALLSRL